MGSKTKIEWTAGTDGSPGASWNPIRARSANGKVGWHCQIVTPGCERCYAQAINKRLGTGLPYLRNREHVETYLDEKMLLAPLRWRKPRKIFVGSMTDLFGDWVTDDMLDRIFAVMALCPQHTFLVLTKRAKRMRGYCAEPQTPKRITAAAFAQARDLPARRGDDATTANWEFSPARIKWPLPNVWLGVSVEDQRRADERIPHLLATPAAVRWISAEPLLGPVDLAHIDVDGDHTINALRPDTEAELWVRQWSPEATGMSLDQCIRDWEDEGGSWPPKTTSTQHCLDWVVAGGESGPGARPMHPAWARSLRDQCGPAGVPFFFKQWGEWVPWEPRFPADVDYLGEDGSSSTNPGLSRTPMVRVGKRAAGRLLDGREWNEYPEPR